MGSATISLTTAECCAALATAREPSSPGEVLWHSAHAVFLPFSHPIPRAFCSYSSGAIYAWDLGSDDGPTRLRQIPGPQLVSEPNCCDLLSPWGVVGTSDGQF